jgi:hypothetical protein
MSVRPLYHYQLGIPREFRTDFGQLFLDYSFHARKAAKTDRYGEISLPEVLDTSAAMVIEVEGGLYDEETKVVYRLPHDDEFDLVMAVIPQRAFVKTVWLNRKSDGHGTLDESKYCRPPGRGRL